MSGFVHLHVHSEYSLLDGFGRIKDLVKKAKDDGMKALALTDHGVMFGVLEFYDECIKQGIKPIIGAEVYVSPGPMTVKDPGQKKSSHLVLLAKNETGYKNLMKLVSKGYVDGYYYKPRVDHACLREHAEGLICLSACLSGEIPKALLAGDFEGAERIARFYQEIFGPDHFYLEIQNHRIAEEARVRDAMLRLSKKTGIPLIATNDVHYVNPEDARYHDVMVCIQTASHVSDEERMRYQGDYSLKSSVEMKNLFARYPGATENTEKIASMVDLSLQSGENHMPVFELPENFTDAGDYLRELCEKGLERLYPEMTEKIRERLDEELSIIHSMGFDNYFLVVWDFIRYARERDIPTGPGRGSAAGSLVAYALGITKLDPLRYNLLFERFLNPERYTMPDIDCDFCYERRQEVIDYVTNKYGKDHVAQIITFGTMAARGAIRDVARVLDLDYNTSDRLAKEIPMRPGRNITIHEALEENKELKALVASDRTIREVVETAQKLEGLNRHAGTHAAGVVISDKPLTEYVPLYRNQEAITTQFTMGLLESQGLIKMDFLGLRTLTVIHDAVENIYLSTGERIDIDAIDLEDPNIYRLIASGDDAGVFQFESSGMISFMKELKPSCFEDIVAGISLYRPGPMQQIPKYIENKQHPERINYLHPALEPILNVTYGSMVYQEQVMQIFRELAGFSMGRADLIRRAMSKKKADVMEAEGRVFLYGEKDADGKVLVEGCLARGIDEASALKIYDEIKQFANYGFNKSHAAAYSVVSCQTAWLKYYYPKEFMAALISSVMDQEGKMSRYMAECSRKGIEILPPDVNSSQTRFTVCDGKILFGLGGVKGVGRGMIEEIIKAREKYGPFKTFTEFCERVEGQGLNKRSILNLIKCGGFDYTGVPRNRLLAGAERILIETQQRKKEQITGQVNLLGLVGEKNPQSIREQFPDLPPASPEQILLMEKEACGLYISGHPLESYQELLEKYADFTFSILDSFEDLSKVAKDQSIVTVGGLVKSVRTQLTKNRELMAFARLEDAYGGLDLVIFPKAYEKFRHLLKEDNPVVIRGKICYDEEMSVSVCADRMTSLEESKKRHDLRNVQKNLKYSAQEPAEMKKIVREEQNTPSLCIHFRDFSQKQILPRLKAVFSAFPGNSAVILYFENENKRFKASEKLRVNVCAELMDQIENMLGNGSVEVLEHG